MFIDISCAFARLFRRIVFDLDEGDEAWYRKLAASGFSVDQIGEIMELIQGYHDEHLSGDPPPPLPGALTTSLYTNTWCSVVYHNGLVSTSRGSMAGMTLGDITYAAAFAKIIHQVMALLIDRKLVFSYIPRGGGADPVFLSPVVFHDDAMFPSVSPSCGYLIETALEAAKIIGFLFATYGLEANLPCPEKSAAMPFAFGRGKRAFNVLVSQQNGSFSFIGHADDHECVTLHIVKVYKHMGTKFLGVLWLRRLPIGVFR